MTASMLLILMALWFLALIAADKTAPERALRTASVVCVIAAITCWILDK